MGNGCSQPQATADQPQLLGKKKYIIDVGAITMQIDERKSTTPGAVVVFAPKDYLGLAISFREKNGNLYAREYTDKDLLEDKDAQGITHGWAPFFKSIASDVTKGRATVQVNSGKEVKVSVIVTSTKDPLDQPYTMVLKPKSSSNKDLIQYMIEPLSKMVQAKRLNPSDHEKEARFVNIEVNSVVRKASIERNTGIIARLDPGMKDLRETADTAGKKSTALSLEVSKVERRLRRVKRPKDLKHPLDALLEDGGARPFAHVSHAEEHEPVERAWMVELADVLRTQLPGKKDKELADHLDQLTRSPSNPEVQRLMAVSKDFPLTYFARLDEWDYNVFEVDSITGGNSLFYTTYALLHKMGLPAHFNIDDTVLRNFLRAIQAGYHPNPYHNSMHAADVTHVNYYIMTKCKLNKECGLTQEQILAGILAGAIHDYDHPGLNNSFHANTNAYLSTLYNDRSILENHHLACVYEILRLPKHNIFAKMTDEQVREIRETMIEMVLSTDMGMHGKILSQFQRRIQEGTPWSTKKEDAHLALSMSIKMADISNCGRPTHLYTNWAKNIAAEFYNQGDVELKLKMPISPFMDRKKDKSDFPKGQASFINFIVIPTFEAMSEFLPDLSFSLQHCTENREYWRRRSD